MKSFAVHVWSDIACPWCYVGKRRLERALDQFAERDAVSVFWRAFELNPAAPRATAHTPEPYAQRLAKKYRTSVDEAQAMIQRMTDVGALEGLDFHFERVRPGNTFDAHRVLRLAAARGVQDAVNERLMRAYMTDGESIAVPETLARLGAEAGLDADAVRATLASDAYTREVRADEDEAHANGIEGVPFFVIGRYGVSGAQPPEVLLHALRTTWDELPADSGPASGDKAQKGAVCGPDGC